MVQLSTSWQVLNSKKVSYYNAYTGNFQLWARIVGTQDIANNRTKVEYQWYHVLEYGWITADQAQDYVTGAGWNSDTYREYTSTKVLRSWEGWISHNADGTGNGSCSGRTNMSTMGVDTDWVSASYTLPTIPRASAPTATPNPLTIGSSGATLTVNTNRKSSSFTHTIKVQCGSWSWTSSARSVGTSVNVTVPYSVIAQFSATSKTASATVTCTTFSGTTQIGSAQTCSVTFQINPNRDHPNIGTVTLSEGNARVASIVATADTFVQGISTLEVSAPITVSGSYTQLDKVTVANGADNKTYTLSGTSGTLNYSCANNRTTWLTITAYDKRGTTAVSKPAWTLLSYAPITMTASVGRVSATGSTATGQISGVAYGGDYGQSTNSLTVTYRWKLHDSTTWTTGSQTYTLPISGSGQQNYSHAITFDEAFDYQYQYDIEFTVNDLFSTAVYTCQLMQGLPIMSWDETEVDVFGNLHIHDRDNPTVWQDVMQGFDAVLAHDGIKNLCPTIVTTTTTVQGVTFTPNADGTFKTAGTSTGPTQIYNEGKVHLPIGTYKFSGCPSGGSTSTYFFRVLIYNSSGALVDYATDKGEGNEFEITDSSYYIRPFVSVNQGATAPSQVWKPMIYDAHLASNEYAPSNPQGTVPTISLSIPRLSQTVNCACLMLNRRAALIYSNFTANTSSNTGNLYIELTSMRYPFIPTGVFGGAMIANKYAMIMRSDGNNNAWFSTLGGSLENVTGAQASGKKIVLCMVIFNTA